MVVRIYTSENCPGMPEGVVVRVHDDALEPDQQAAWARAHATARRIYWEQQKRKQEGTTDK